MLGFSLLYSISTRPEIFKVLGVIGKKNQIEDPIRVFAKDGPTCLKLHVLYKTAHYSTHKGAGDFKFGT